MASAGREHVEAAVAAARRAWPAWAALGAAARAEFLRRAAGAMRRHRFDLAAWEVFECGKGWREADADVCEAIDFCEYYADGAVEHGDPARRGRAGRRKSLRILAPRRGGRDRAWNFPLAILTGMTAAALATGNTVVMKPAEQSSVIAAKLMEIFTELGLPPGVLNYLPGTGEVVGAALVDHPRRGPDRVHGIAGRGLADQCPRRPGFRPASPASNA